MSDDIKTIQPDELEAKLENEDSIDLIDVREDEEIAQGKIPQAKHIRLSELPERYQELDTDKSYAVICRSGRRSHKACEFLEEKGLDVRNMVGGMLKWQGHVE
ncbi:rhodanese-like domain-containing protein [Tuberibacillus sp. Marseille-P3662]|uniref:rhodanese-like domain-containing protein n=1 Tax=Tuberibacillus sp. Marseille-P3662 TaxID=1965358 RepID=UPI000A1C9A90|nr:rhodanese-like domain-containing protein [Tuberibacillus sp. Marseille-P3662]